MGQEDEGVPVAIGRLKCDEGKGNELRSARCSGVSIDGLLMSIEKEPKIEPLSPFLEPLSLNFAKTRIQSSYCIEVKRPIKGRFPNGMDSTSHRALSPARRASLEPAYHLAPLGHHRPFQYLAHFARRWEVLALPRRVDDDA